MMLDQSDHGFQNLLEIRSAFRLHPARKEPLWMKALSSFTLTLEAFLHTHIGVRALSPFRIAFGALLLYIYALVASGGLDWQPMGNVAVAPLQAVRGMFEAVFGPAALSTLFGSSIVALAIWVFVGVALVHRLHIFLNDRQGKPAWHSRCSGEPFIVWDLLYLLQRKLRFRADLVRIVGEPMLCIIIGSVIGRMLEGTGYLFLSRWLIHGGIALALKSYLEFRAAEQVLRDQSDNRHDMASFQARKSFSNEPERLVRRIL